MLTATLDRINVPASQPWIWVLPVLVDEQVALVERTETLYLEGYWYARIAGLPNSEAIPSPQRSVWKRTAAERMLTQESYGFLIVWGHNQRTHVFEPEGPASSAGTCQPHGEWQAL